MNDMIAKGRQAPASAHASLGVQNGRALLSAAQVAEMRRLYLDAADTQRGLARRFGVSLALVQKILGGCVWRYPEAGYTGPIKTPARGKWHRSEHRKGD